MAGLGAEKLREDRYDSDQLSASPVRFHEDAESTVGASGWFGARYPTASPPSSWREPVLADVS